MRVMNLMKLRPDVFEVHYLLDFSRKVTDNEAPSTQWFLTNEIQGRGKLLHKAI